MIQKFCPTENELFEYYKSKSLSPIIYRGWLHGQLRDIVRLGIELDMFLIPLVSYSKVPKEHPYKPLNYEQALDHLSGRNENEYIGNLGVCGAGQFVLLDYDLPVLAPRLEALARKTLTIMTPNGWTFVTREPFDIELWTKLEELIPGFGLSREQSKIRVEEMKAIMERNTILTPENGFSDEERDYFTRQPTVVGNARRGVSYVCMPGSITCSYQQRIASQGNNNHSLPTEPCNGASPDGKHDYHVRMIYKKDGDYTNFVPRSTTVLPFKYFAKKALESAAQ